MTDLWTLRMTDRWGDNVAQVEADSEQGARAIVKRWWGWSCKSPAEIHVELATEDRRRPLVTNAPELARALFPRTPIGLGTLDDRGCALPPAHASRAPPARGSQPSSCEPSESCAQAFSTARAQRSGKRSA